MRTNDGVLEQMIDEAARRLFDARAEKAFLDLQRDPFPACDLNEAYAIQAAAHSRRGAPVAGYKIGLTNKAAQSAMGASEPIVGRLAPCDIFRSPAKIPVSRHLRIVEAELIFEMGRDLDAASLQHDRSNIVAAIAGVYAGIEVCNSRFGPDDVPLNCLIADNSNAHVLVIGGRMDGLRPMDLVDLPVTLSREGKPDIAGSGANVMGDPLVALTWLANWLALRGECLKRGQFIATGSCTGMTELAVGELAVARFGAFGQAAVEFVPFEGGDVG